jgi:putative intracellular protease/amidase
MRRSTFIRLPVIGLGLLTMTSLARANAAARERVLIVLTNTAKVPGTERATGVWASEYTDPWRVFSDAGYEVHVASPRGGVGPIDPRSGSGDSVKRIPAAWAAMQATRPLAELKSADYAAVFLSGGHGTMWDFPDDPNLRRIVEETLGRSAPVGAVCHGPAGLLSARKADGTPWVAGRRVNGFTNLEEAAAGMKSVLPFLLEDRLRALGGRFESAGVFQRHVAVDGALVTGQNPASSTAVAEAMLELLRKRRTP